MQYTDFKGLKISRLGFGTMRLPMNGEGKIDYEEGQRMLDYALANGINYIDTAYMYHEGRSEVFTGKAIASHPRDSFYLADKMPIWLCKTEEDVDRIFEKQLSKCNVDYFDFYLLHNVDEDCWPTAIKFNMVDHLKKQMEKGRIRHLGASFHCSPELLREVLTTCGDALEFVQLQINYFDWEYDETTQACYNIAREFGKPIIVMEPLRGGMLANPMSQDACRILDEAAEAATCPTSVMSNAAGAACADTCAETACTGAEAAACAETACTGAACADACAASGADACAASGSEAAQTARASYPAYALHYVNEIPGIMITLSGMSNLTQMKDNIEIFNRPAMTEGEKSAVAQAVKTLKNDILVPCTGCNYCFECPSGIKIPEIFKLYNEAAVKGFHWIWGSLSGLYNEMEPNAKACIGCGACESHCPQKIKIIDKLKEIDAKYAELEAAGE